MEPEDMDEVQNDQEIERMASEMGREAQRVGKKVSNKANKEVKKAKSAISKAIPTPLKIKIALIAGGVVAVLVAVSVIFSLFNSNKAVGSAIEQIMQESVKIVKSEGQGYYYKIDKDVVKTFVKKLNEVSESDDFETDMDSVLDYDESSTHYTSYDGIGNTNNSSSEDEVEKAVENASDEEIEEKAEEKEQEEESETNSVDDEAAFSEGTLEDWFKTENKEQAEAYLVRMIRTEIESTYPRIGTYVGEDDTEDSQGNKRDADGDYAAQGMIKIERSSTSSSSAGAGEITTVSSEVINDNINLSLKKIDDMEFYEIRPVDTEPDLPIIVYLHGDGQVGNFKGSLNLDITQYITSGEAYKSGKFIYIAPHTNVFDWSGKIEKVKQLIDKTVQAYAADPSRIIIAGASRGAIGTWGIANSYPNFFAAAVPMSCGGAIRAENFVTTPVWAISGTSGEDEASYNAQMQRNVDLINAAGGNAKKETIQGESHMTIAKYFARKELFDWMLSQKRNDIVPETNSTSNTQNKGIIKTIGDPIKADTGKTKHDYNGIEYLQVLPENPTTNMPIIVYLHCSASQNSGNVEKITYYDTFPYVVERGDGYKVGKFILIAPYGRWNSNSSVNNLISLIDHVAEEYKADKSRISIVGFSMGAMGVWNAVNSKPNYFAAAMPVSGDLQYCRSNSINAKNFSTTAVYAIWGKGDGWCSGAMTNACNAINNAGGNAQYEEVDYATHDDTQHCFSSKEAPKFFEWLLSQRQYKGFEHLKATEIREGNGTNKKERPLNVAPGESSGSYGGLQYLQIMPEEPTTNMPIIVYLHCIGPVNAGSLGAVKSDAFYGYVQHGEAFEAGKFIFIAPFAPNGWPAEFDKVVNLLDHITEIYEADGSRISACGFSHGSHVWGLINAYPDYFSAAAPVSGDYSFRKP